jgi:hypothetical protein
LHDHRFFTKKGESERKRFALHDYEYTQSRPIVVESCREGFEDENLLKGAASEKQPVQ